MTNEEVTNYCLGLPATIEDHPFGPIAHVYKVAGKMFALLPEEAEIPYVSVKCDPDWAIMLRDQFKGIHPAYHLNKRHWNGIDLHSDVPKELIKDLIRHSYECVVNKLPRDTRAALPPLNDEA